MDLTILQELHKVGVQVVLCVQKHAKPYPTRIFKTGHFAHQRTLHQNKVSTSLTFSNPKLDKPSSTKGHNGQTGHQEEQKAKIHQLIYKISEHYGGDSPEFLELYIQDVLHDWTHDLDSALACFQDVVSKLNPAGLRRKEEIRERNERATGVYMRVNEDCERVSDKEDRFSYKSQPEFFRKNTENQGGNFHA